MLSSRLHPDRRGPARKRYKITEAGYGILQTAIADLLSQPRALGSGFELGLINLHIMKPKQVYQVLRQHRDDLIRQLDAVEQSWERHQANDSQDTAEQIQAHAEQAPYPHVARCLEHLVLEKRNSVKLLSKEILNLQGDPSIHQLDLQSGKNHWERINRDIEDQKVLVGNLLESSAHWAEKAPQIAELLKRITTVENSHKETLIQLLMRADPQAEQN